MVMVLMFEVIYKLGCRAGEFVRIQVKHVNFSRSTVFFPAENTTAKHARASYLTIKTTLLGNRVILFQTRDLYCDLFDTSYPTP
jgi:integrase